jgi:hypothetical protein
MIVLFSKTLIFRRSATRRPRFCLAGEPPGSSSLAGSVQEIIDTILGGKLLSAA